MEKANAYDNFPLWIVLLSGLYTVLLYALGAYIMAGLGLIWMALFLLYCLFLEMRIMKMSCVHCYYYGKFCGLVRGKLAAVFFKKGDPQKFLEKKISWKDIIPDFLVIVIPLIAGIILLIQGFTWTLLAVLGLLLILFMGGTPVIRGMFACKYCKQREFGCPADELFNTKK
ncbi:hypothetical protein ACFL57_02765 [Candidatus Margulisiibacteriota bacterium]